MSSFRNVFKRCELKYMLDTAQYAALQTVIAPYMQADEYGRSVICNLYFDTPDYRLIRTSLQKPVYKEKLRLRCYGIPTPDSTAFVELKKKYKGTVYKRRESMTYREAFSYLCEGAMPPKDTQILREIDWFRHLYAPLAPSMVITGERLALFGKDNQEFRLTFDENIRFRETALDLAAGAEGEPLLEPGHWLMEVKLAGAMPLWLAKELDRLRIYPTSFSKYGTAFIRSQQKARASKEENTCA